MSNIAEASRVEPAETSDAVVTETGTGADTPDQFTPSEPGPPANDIGPGASPADKGAPGTKRAWRLDEPEQAKRSFLTILDEADVAIRVFDQEKRRILGITYALSQIEQSFERLCARFEDLEKRVDYYTASNDDLRGRFEASIESIRTRDDREAELLKDNFSLRAALANIDRQLAQQADDVRALGNDNAALRQKLAAMECDTGLVLDEIGYLRDDITVLSSAGEMTAPAAMSAAKPAAAPIAARRDEPRVVDSPAPVPPPPEPQPEVADPEGVDDVMSDICSSIAFHMNEAALLRSKIENLLAADAAIPTPHRAAPNPPEPPSRAPAAACEHELTDLKALLRAYQDVIHDLDLTRGALLSHSDPGNNAPAPAVKAVPAPSPAPVDGGADRSTGRVVVPPAIRDAARPDPAGEWPRERQDRRSAEGALRTARQERAHLQRELAQIKASYARTVAAETDIADAARH